MTIRQNLTIRVGETWSFEYIHTANGAPVDLTGYSARMAIKREYDVSSRRAYLSTGSDAISGTIVLGGVTGVVTLAMTAADTDGLLMPAYRDQGDDGIITKLIYDLELVDSAGIVTRALQGMVEIVRSVTR